jgi:hypothetical protein
VSTDFTPTTTRRPTQRVGPSGDLRVLRDVAAAVQPAPSPADMRICRVSARDTSLRTITVELGGDAANPVSGVRVANTSYYPRINDLAVVVQQRSDLYALGAVNAKVGHMRIRKGTTSAISDSTRSLLTMGAAVPEVDTDSIWGAGGSTSRITFPWPGIWRVDYQAFWTDATTGRRFIDIEDNAGTIRASERHEVEGGANAQEVTCNPSVECYFDAGDWVEAYAYQSSGGPLSIQDFPFSNIWTASWRGPA